MAQSNRSARRPQLFSLKARMERIARRARLEIAEEGEIDDDGCPICVAMRTNKNFDMRSLGPAADGGAPRVDPRILYESARRKLAKEKPTGDGVVRFFSVTTVQPDQTFAESVYSVDGAGRIYWTTDGMTSRTLIAQLPALN